MKRQSGMLVRRVSATIGFTVIVSSSRKMKYIFCNLVCYLAIFSGAIGKVKDPLSLLLGVETRRVSET